MCFVGCFVYWCFFSMVNHQKMMFLTVKVAPCHPWRRWKSTSLVIWKGRSNQRGGWWPSYSEKGRDHMKFGALGTSMPRSSKTDSPSLWPTICAPTGGAMLAEICWQRLGRQQRVALLAKPTRVENTKPETPHQKYNKCIQAELGPGNFGIRCHETDEIDSHSLNIFHQHVH